MSVLVTGTRFAVPIWLVLNSAAFGQGCGNRVAAGAGAPPVAVTPLVLQLPQSEIQPVRGTDGQLHLAYVAQIANLAPQTFSIDAVQPLDALTGKPTGRTLVRDMDGKNIAGAMRLYAPALLGKVTPGETDFGRIPGGSLGMSFFSLTYPASASLPRLISHRIAMHGADGKKLQVLTDPVAVACAPPVVLQPPLSGPGWWDANGCCDTISPHRGAILPVNGQMRAPEQFGIDFVQVRADGGCCSGAPDDLKNWPFFGAPVFASATGRVLEVLDGLPEQPVGKPVGITASNAPGNHMIQDIGGGRFIAYCHFKTGSISLGIRPGVMLQAGEKIGEVGNTGSSTAPHLHFQVMDRPSVLNSTGLPFVFARQFLAGHVAGSANAVEHNYEVGGKLSLKAQTATIHRNEMPLEGDLLEFGERRTTLSRSKS